MERAAYIYGDLFVIGFLILFFLKEKKKFVIDQLAL